MKVANFLKVEGKDNGEDIYDKLTVMILIIIILTMNRNENYGDDANEYDLS
jgi:hypothetical protein